MQINYDKIKHTAGLVALGLMVPAQGVPKYGTALMLALGFVAFMCGVQSEKMFEKSVVDTLSKKDQS